MKDAELVRGLIHRYAELLDQGDLDGVAALFARATFRSSRSGEVWRGAEQVRHVYDDVILYDGLPCTQHVVSNVTIVSDGIDVATARSSFTVFQARPDFPLQPIVAGRYEDEFQRVDGTWWFTDRLVCPDLVGDLSHHLRRRL